MADHRETSTMMFTAITSTGRAFDIEFPLHPGTRSGEQVSQLVTDLLDTLTRQVDGEPDISHGDILQALAITLAIRTRIMDAHPETVREVIGRLFDTAFAATHEARSYTATRA